MDVQAFIVLLRLTHMHTQTRPHAMAIIHYFLRCRDSLQICVGDRR